MHIRSKYKAEKDKKEWRPYREDREIAQGRIEVNGEIAKGKGGKRAQGRYVYKGCSKAKESNVTSLAPSARR